MRPPAKRLGGESSSHGFESHSLPPTGVCARLPHTQLSPSSYHIWTIGCQMNTADSERLAGALEGMGLKETSRPQDADVVVLNSCVVRQSAEDKVVGMITSLKPVMRSSPDRIFALMGCMVGPGSAQLQKRFPYVDVFMRPQQYEPLIKPDRRPSRRRRGRLPARTLRRPDRASQRTCRSSTAATSSARSASSRTAAAARRAAPSTT